jgi:hypothetical protein
MIDLTSILYKAIKDDEFGEFCEGCEARVTEYDGYTTCPADDDPSDRGCARHKDWKEIKFATESAQDAIECVLAKFKKDERAA